MRLQHFIGSIFRRALYRAIFERFRVQQKWPADCRRTILLSSQNHLVSNAVARTFQSLLNRVFPQFAGCHRTRTRPWRHRSARELSTEVRDARIDMHRDGGVTCRIAIGTQSLDRSLATCLRISLVHACDARHATCGTSRMSSAMSCIATASSSRHAHRTRTRHASEARHSRRSTRAARRCTHVRCIDCVRAREKFARVVASTHRFFRHASRCSRVSAHDDALLACRPCMRSRSARTQQCLLL